MKPKDDIETKLAADRAKAGSRYAAAVKELEAALVDLAAQEILLSHAREGQASDGKGVNMLTFAGAQPDGFAELRHREFVPNPPSKLQAAIGARVQSILASMPV